MARRHYFTFENLTYRLEEDGLHHYGLTMWDGSKRSDHYYESWVQWFYSQKPMTSALKIIKKHYEESERVFRMARCRYGAEVVRDIREELGEETARDVLRDDAFYIFPSRNREIVWKYFELEHEQKYGFPPASEEELDSYIYENYWLIPCGKGCIVIKSNPYIYA